MSPKYRILYLLLGFTGFVILVCYILIKLPEFNPGIVLMISIPDMIIFFLAYRTYPIEEAEEIERVRRGASRLSSKA